MITVAVRRSTGGGGAGASEAGCDVTEPLLGRREERDRRADLTAPGRRRGLDVLELEADRRTAGLAEGARAMAAMAEDASAK